MAAILPKSNRHFDAAVSQSLHSNISKRSLVLSAINAANSILGINAGTNNAENNMIANTPDIF